MKRRTYKDIVAELLKFGKADLPNWDKETFVIICMQDYGVHKTTAERVYEHYHKAIKAIAE